MAFFKIKKEKKWWGEKKSIKKIKILYICGAVGGIYAVVRFDTLRYGRRSSPFSP